ncbi:hypothetical protein ACLB2K_033820 [Fragaria x ananassa]
MASSSSSSAPKNGDDLDSKLTGLSLEETCQSLPTPVLLTEAQMAIAATQARIREFQTEILVKWELKRVSLKFEEMRLVVELIDVLKRRIAYVERMISDVEDQIDRVEEKIDGVDIQVDIVEMVSVPDELRSAISEAQNDIVKQQDYILGQQNNIFGEIPRLQAP